MAEKATGMKTPKPTIKSPAKRAKTSSRRAKRNARLEQMKKNKPYIFELVKKNANPSIAGRHYPVQYIIASTDVIYDPQSNSNRRIRYAPGEKSIFVDEQSENVTKSSISISNGRLLVRKNQPHLYEYLMACNANADNPHRDKRKAPIFKLRNDEKDVAGQIAAAEKTMEAVNLVFNMDEDKLLANAMVMGVNIDRSLSEIRFDLKVIAEKDPTKFIDTVNDPRAERKYHVLLAEDYDIIGHDHYQYYWKRGGEKFTIVNIPIGKNPIDYFVDFLYEKDGETVYSQIVKELED